MLDESRVDAGAVNDGLEHGGDEVFLLTLCKSAFLGSVESGNAQLARAARQQGDGADLVIGVRTAQTMTASLSDL